jgi:hypothetical protein
VPWDANGARSYEAGHKRVEGHIAGNTAVEDHSGPVGGKVQYRPPFSMKVLQLTLKSLPHDYHGQIPARRSTRTKTGGSAHGHSQQDPSG